MDAQRRNEIAWQLDLASAHRIKKGQSWTHTANCVVLMAIQDYLLTHQKIKRDLREAHQELSGLLGGEAPSPEELFQYGMELLKETEKT